MVLYLINILFFYFIFMIWTRLREWILGKIRNWSLAKQTAFYPVLCSLFWGSIYRLFPWAQWLSRVYNSLFISWKQAPSGSKLHSDFNCEKNFTLVDVDYLNDPILIGRAIFQEKRDLKSILNVYNWDNLIKETNNDDTALGFSVFNL